MFFLNYFLNHQCSWKVPYYDKCPSWRHILLQPHLSWLAHNLVNIYDVIKQNCTACCGIIPSQCYMFKKEIQVVGLTGTITCRTMFFGLYKKSKSNNNRVKSSSLKYFWSIFKTSLLNYQQVTIWPENSDKISTDSILCVTNWLCWY